MAPDTVSRTKRVSAPSARVIDPDNIGEKQLSSHRAAQAEAILRAEAEAALRAQEANQEWASHTGSSPAATDPSHEEARMEIERVANSNRPLSPVPASRRKRKPIVEDSDSDSQDGTQPSSSQKRARTAESQDTTLPATNQLDEDGFLKDINIQAIDNDTMSNKRREDTSRDLNEFFAEAFEVSAPEGKRKRRRCLKCEQQGNSDNDNRRAILFADEDDGEYTEPDDEDDSEITIQSIDP
ncbi:hypothetical protein PC9H_004386 [Pleurotus ostreatus]|uniref:Uncharacterized protein n=1 Tax=Pleurotus ostreatus TaxID=5322 RepID=A0A8H7A2L3_PLEOS|nr:uncharacterized protein PC9H_004386 [Pleurotus ostreatus]KAF7437544.1 hypothetical protein PC9H_004386 [Pleurotus ostreatus]KAJ8703492.1 hypothetical protein PTI98_002114 [Pleurotus ostreatus]